MNFRQLMKYDNNPPDKGLPRKTGVLIEYRNYVKSSLKSTAELVQEYFDKHPNEQYIVTKNKFPYDLDDTIVHAVVWKNPESNISAEILRTIFDEAFGGEFVMFMNKPEVVSVDTDHYQLFFQTEHEDVDAIELVELC